MLSGRRGGLSLSPTGISQARALADCLAGTTLDAVHASPLERAQSTARALAERLNLPVRTVDDLQEVDFGDWTGRSFAELEGNSDWAHWNAHRAAAAAPGGESMAQAQARAMEHVLGAAQELPGGTIAMVTHCDIIRAVVCAVLGLSLDRILAFDVDPASITRLTVDRGQGRLHSLNECPAAR